MLNASEDGDSKQLPFSASEAVGEIAYIPINLPNWIDLPPEYLDILIKRINPYIEPVRFSPSPNTTGKVRELPCYDECYVIELTNLEATPPYSKYVFLLPQRPNNIWVVDWTVEPIYAVNDRASLNLEAGAVVAYLQIFTDFVFTADGQRYIISSADDIPWQPGSAEAEEEKQDAQRLIVPPTLTAAYEDGGFSVDVTDLAGFDLYRSTVYVTSNGRVDWLIQECIMQDLTIVRRDLLV